MAKRRNQRLLTKKIAERMRRNAQTRGDHIPVLKLFVPWGAGTWLLTELDAAERIAFGLCDLGFGCPELGYVDLDEIAAVRAPGGLRIERDMHFRATYPLSAYTEDAVIAGHITTIQDALRETRRIVRPA